MLEIIIRQCCEEKEPATPDKALRGKAAKALADHPEDVADDEADVEDEDGMMKAVRDSGDVH